MSSEQIFPLNDINSMTWKTWNLILFRVLLTHFCHFCSLHDIYGASSSSYHRSCQKPWCKSILITINWKVYDLWDHNYVDSQMLEEEMHCKMWVNVRQAANMTQRHLRIFLVSYTCLTSNFSAKKCWCNRKTQKLLHKMWL